MFVITIEWDGKKPSSVFYRRLHDAGVFIRNKDRRSPEQQIVAQEGAIFTTNLSAAYIYAALARNCGALTVSIHEVSPPIETVCVIPPVAEKFLRPQRGRKKLFKQIGLSCYSCMTTLNLEDAPLPVICPRCQSTRIRVIESAIDTAISIPHNPDPQILADGVIAGNDIVIFPTKITISSAAAPAAKSSDKRLVDACRFALYNSTSPHDAAKWAPILYALQLMTREERVMERVAFLQQYYLRGGTNLFNINPPDEGVDECDLEMAKHYASSKNKIEAGFF